MCLKLFKVTGANFPAPSFSYTPFNWNFIGEYNSSVVLCDIRRIIINGGATSRSGKAAVEVDDSIPLACYLNLRWEIHIVSALWGNIIEEKLSKSRVLKSPSPTPSSTLMEQKIMHTTWARGKQFMLLWEANFQVLMFCGMFDIRMWVRIKINLCRINFIFARRNLGKSGGGRIEFISIFL